jgi:hypothetical protein
MDPERLLQTFRSQQLGERAENDHVERVFAPGAFKQRLRCESRLRKQGKSAAHRLAWSGTGSSPLWHGNRHCEALREQFRARARPQKYAGNRKRAGEPARHRENLIKAKEADPNESDETRCVHAFMGSLKSADVMTDFAHLSIGSAVEGERQFQYLAFDLM